MARANETNPVGGEGVPEGLLSSPRSREHRFARDVMERARDVPAALNHANERFVGFVRDKPLVALGVALGAGYVLGRMLRRMV